MKEYIEMTAVLDGKVYAVREELPALMRLSRGPMSVLGAMAGARDRMSGRLALLIDNNENTCEFIPYRSNDASCDFKAWNAEEAVLHGYLVTPTRKEHHDCD